MMDDNDDWFPRARTRYLARRHERLDLKGEHRVGGPVGGLYYVPDFITAGEGRLLQEAIQRQPEQDGSNSEWKDLHKRRLQIHGGTPHPSGMVEEALPPFLSQGEHCLENASKRSRIFLVMGRFSSKMVIEPGRSYTLCRFQYS